MTAWITPTDELAERCNLPVVPVPVSESTAAMLETGRIEPSAIALDIDTWLLRGDHSTATRSVLSRYVATLAYIGALELIDHGQAETAARLLEVGVRRMPDDPSMRANLGLALWDAGFRYDALAQLMTASAQCADAGQCAPMLWILTARALSEAGRHDDAVSVLELLADTEPRVARFWDLLDTLEARRESAAAG
jgi:predicted Zn-dependent protease